MRIRGPLSAALLLLSAAPAAAAMRCGTHLITEGDTAAEMRRRCGAPDDVDVRTILRPPVIWRHGRPLHVPGGEIEVRVEYWTYNFGPNLLMRRVRVEDGRVKDIQTLGHGYL
jgi:hypothetical protein